MQPASEEHASGHLTKPRGGHPVSEAPSEAPRSGYSASLPMTEGKRLKEKEMHRVCATVAMDVLIV